MYQNFEGLERGEDIKNFKFFWVFPNPLGVLNQKDLFPTLIYQFEHLLHWSGTPLYLQVGRLRKTDIFNFPRRKLYLELDATT